VPSQTPFNALDAIASRIKEVGYDNLNDHEKGYYAVWWFCAETNNGGLHQFFFNSTGGYVPEVTMGLRMMGATETLKILERAMSLFGRSTLPRDDNERRDIVLQMSEADEQELNALTNKFYEYPDDVHAKMEEFAAKNRDQFGDG
jgi:hypothetical protein